ncbi:RICIN domain-containing protein [Nonomuraea sp. H19]|uniref:RICIN domain-containing protein n=1 Tax=Nonomuraea sp. H19 TaxID=3452206 RepID=UPI003F8B0F6D
MRTAITLLAGVTLAGGLLAVPAQATTGSSGSVVELKNLATGMCLAIGRGEARKGKAAIQWPCNGGWAQRWKPKRLLRIKGVPEDELRAYHFMNGATQMCLAIGGGQARKGKSAIQWPCKKGGREQAWQITKVG